MTYLLIGANVAVFIFQLTLDPERQQEFVYRFGIIPYLLTDAVPAGKALWSLQTPFTSIFVHGSVMHILGNMWFLWVFGDNVEDNLGKVKYVLFYFACGLAASAAQLAVNPDSQVPMVGASGAIAGVLAGYVLLYPRAPILTLVPIFIFIHFVELPAFIFIFVWFGFQLLSGSLALGTIATETGGVAWFAHIGGFLAGLLLMLLMRKPTSPQPPRRRPHPFHDRYSG